MVEKVDKKLNPLKPGDEVIMTQGGVRVHVLLKRQVGMFWSVKPAGGGPLVHNVLFLPHSSSREKWTASATPF